MFFNFNLWPEWKTKKQGAVTYGKDQGNKVRKDLCLPLVHLSQQVNEVLVLTAITFWEFDASQVWQLQLQSETWAQHNELLSGKVKNVTFTETNNDFFRVKSVSAETKLLAFHMQAIQTSYFVTQHYVLQKVTFRLCDKNNEDI